MHHNFYVHEKINLNKKDLADVIFIYGAGT